MAENDNLGRLRLLHQRIDRAEGIESAASADDHVQRGTLHVSLPKCVASIGTRWLCRRSPLRVIPTRLTCVSTRVDLIVV